VRSNPRVEGSTSAKGELRRHFAALDLGGQPFGRHWQLAQGARLLTHPADEVTFRFTPGVRLVVWDMCTCDI
jgi:hypothetical protein